MKPWGVEGYLYLQKELANDCAIFGTSSHWYFPYVEKVDQGNENINSKSVVVSDEDLNVLHHDYYNVPDEELILTDF